MASIDQQPTVSLQSTATAENEVKVVLNAGSSEGPGDSVKDSSANVSPNTTPTTPASNPQSTTAPSSPDSDNKPPAAATGDGSSSSSSSISGGTTSRTTLLPLGSGNGAHASATPMLAPAVAPQPKRFAASNINKKFLEKNSSSSSTTSVSTPLSSSKTGASASHSQTLQSTSSHSRLVTAKLTATPQSSTTTGPGWSRPSSAAPPATAANQAPATNGPPGSTQAPTLSSAAPQLPHVGKVILPQKQKDVAMLGGGAGNKPVWGSIRSAPVVGASWGDFRTGKNDFPTAAEVAQGSRKVKESDVKTAEIEAAHKQARMVEADTFRGVHLNPNAHHWDEIDEDDDNFLDGVIEFGDGRQYKIEATDAPAPPRKTSSPPSNDSRSRSRVSDAQGPSTAPVTKEDRFADDFDRSWPRSRASSASSPQDLTSFPGLPGIPHAHAISATSTSSLSPQDSSRVLFNERSNRLEPYSSNAHRGPFHNKRAEFSPTESRFGRDQPPQGSSQTSNNVQLLQKSGDLPARPRGFNNNSGQGPYDRHREYGFGHHDGSHPPSHPSHSPLSTSNTLPSSSSLSGKEHEAVPADRGRRMSNMGPPPIPRAREVGRQAPPHLAVSGDVPPSQHIPSARRMSSRDSKFAGGPPSSSGRSVRHLSQSPSLSHASATIVSPVLELNGQILPDLDEMRRDLMQSAAARAKQRRQQEEEEREREKERARRKAAEIEERFNLKKPAPVAQIPQDEAAVIAVIEAATKSAPAPVPKSPELSKVPAVVDPLDKRRPPSLKGLSRPSAWEHPPLRRTSASSVAPCVDSPATVPPAIVESWRSKANPRPPPPAAAPRSTHRPPSFIAPPPSALEQSLAEAPEADIEVVDFSEMHKFVGVSRGSSPPEEMPEEMPASSLLSRPSRPTASDFFDERPSANTDDGAGAWRKKAAPPPSSPDADVSKPSQAKDGLGNHTDTSVTHTRNNSLNDSYSQTSHALPPPSPTSSFPSRSPRNSAHHRVAAMVALDDAMSRIKGALDVMQAQDPHRAPGHTPADLPAHAQHPPGELATRRDKWVPPPLRPQHYDAPPVEVFHVTAVEPPLSPKPAWNTYSVHLPKAPQSKDSVGKKPQILPTKVYSLRWPDVSSFSPPVEGMNRRDLSVNDVLFRKPVVQGKYKYQVALPRSSNSPAPTTTTPGTAQVVLPKVNGVGAFGKASPVDGASWRKPVASPVNLGPVLSLDTTSRSPPPDVPSDTASLRSPSGSLRSRSQPKMPAGSSVAFLKDSKVVEAGSDPVPAVSFIVSSELEESKKQSSASSKQPTITVSSPALASVPSTSSSSSSNKTIMNGIKSTSPSASSPGINLEGTVNDKAVSPPPTWPSILVKESPSRGIPDREHLKAVWSQAPSKTDMRPVNSLEGIADDLTSLPFTLQDVKSEDGETPPPTAASAAPVRLSLQDVRRAFQQVPTSSSPVPPRPAISPPTTTAPVARPPPSNYSYQPSPQHQNMRPPSFSPYSPMMTTASPMMYSQPIPGSPVPGRMQMNGQPLYPQPMWMPVPGTGPQTPGGMMRPMSSPYLPHAMPVSYPSPGTQPMYLPPHNMQNSQQQNSPQQNGSPNRGRTMSMMSPGIQYATPMYGGSPVMMHAQSRGPGRNDPGQQPHLQHPPNSFVPMSPFSRPTW